MYDFTFVFVITIIAFSVFETNIFVFQLGFTQFEVNYIVGNYWAYVPVDQYNSEFAFVLQIFLQLLHSSQGVAEYYFELNLQFFHALFAGILRRKNLFPEFERH